ncbi:MAG TPA: hypothetical protein VHD87_09420 [Acidimicrobiales bacterium]|nr:hypothetical protein [Acidimicrobiales bacterium]
MIRRLLAAVGILCLVPIGRGLLMGSLTVFTAAQRAMVLITIIWLLERFVVPLIVAVAFHDGPVPGALHAASVPNASAVVPNPDVTTAE